MWCSYAPAPAKFRGVPSIAARDFISRVTSISERPGGTPSSARIFSDEGISSNRSSMRCTPIASSIDFTSASEWGMKGMDVKRKLGRVGSGKQKTRGDGELEAETGRWQREKARGYMGNLLLSCPDPLPASALSVRRLRSVRRRHPDRAF